MNATHSLARRASAEFAATLLLLAAVIGSGIMAERLAAGNAAVALLANTLATAFALFALIEAFGPVSGAHMNPLVTLWARDLSARERIVYAAAQLVGAACGAWLANLMFERPIFEFAGKARGGIGQWAAEVVATAGLLFIVSRISAARASCVVAAYIGSAYWFTSSTSFANPAAAFGRMFSDSFAGIAPASIAGFVAAQITGSALGVGFARWLDGPTPRAPDVPDPIDKPR